MTKVEYDTVMKVVTWFEEMVDRDDAEAKSCRFGTLTRAYISDAKNYRHMANDLRKVAILDK